MQQSDAECVMRVYGGFSRALLSVADIGALAPSKGNDARVSAGVAVYRNNVRAAYLRVLNDAFPVVFRLVGDGFFRFMAHEYFHAHPPQARLVARYGDHLPAFLEQFEPARVLPYLPDIARLEIAWLKAYHAEESVSLRPDELFGIVGEHADRARLTLHPSTALLASPHPIHAIWSHNHDKKDGPLRLSQGGERVLIVRPDGDVIVETIDAATFLVIEAIAAGERLGAAVEAALDQQPDAVIAETMRIIANSGIVTAATVE
ncbi:MAG TPA: DUF2063 domain-containing protein [Parvularcula sp.]|nr:DUF2063 domain-containing protein [Parvularcula sp.]